MKAHINYPCCGRCGYQYDPKNKKRMIMYKCEDGDYVACHDCIIEYGEFLSEEHTEEEKHEFFKTFFVPHSEVTP